jgi:membrane-associated protein
MEFFRRLFELIFGGLGDDAKWRAMIDSIGTPTLYFVLFAIIFAETGLVVTPFLPGDSLLFAAGAIGARGVGIHLPTIAVLLIVAAVIGDAVNYWIGYKLGPRVFTADDEEDLWPQADSAPRPGGQVAYETPPRKKKSLRSRLLNKKHLLKAQTFYDKYGGKTIILARFVPVVRTFAPFVAGVGKMNFLRFWLFNVVGAVAWVSICVAAGYFFGNFKFVKEHFEWVIVAIVVISILPMAVEFWNARRAAGRRGSAPAGGTTVAGSTPGPSASRPGA